MQKYSSISQQQPAFPEYLDFQALRAVGIDHLQKLSGNLWTDYNLHDPGVTLLEVLCYAITDLGYRNNLDTRDLLAPNPATPLAKDDNFFTPDEILTCNPVTTLDIRKRLVDIQGVRNAWIKKADNVEPAMFINMSLSELQHTQPSPDSQQLSPKGLYTVYLDLAPEIRANACGQNYQPWEDVLAEVKAVLHSHRNLCEDIHELVVLGEEKIGLTTEIELGTGADAETVLVEIYTQVQHFLAPYLTFYTLRSLLEKGKSTADIFAGRPSALPEHDAQSAYSPSHKSHGFIDTDELETLTLPTVIRTSDLYQIILNVPGVVAIKTLTIASYINDLLHAQADAWYLHLTESYRPVLGIEHSHIQFTKQGLPIPFDPDIVSRRYAQQQIVRLKAQRDAYDLDLPIPTGTHYNIADHYSIHHEFPLTYGINEAGLPNTASDERKAQAKQLKGYLVFFDQILANYLNQLSQVRSLFSWDETQWPMHGEQQQTYITQALDFPGMREILRSAVSEQTEEDASSGMHHNRASSLAYTDFLQTIVEDSAIANERRHRMLDHLLSRFAETFTDYSLLNYQMSGDAGETKRLHDKAHFLEDYPVVSRDRFRALNYSDPYRGVATRPDRLPHNSRGISGFQKRLERLLGIEANPADTDSDERFFLIEHILLRPRPTLFTDPDLSPALLPINTDFSVEYQAAHPAAIDPYSFWISVLFPAWPRRFNDPSFRQLVERTVRMEAPAHVVMKIGWFDKEQMQAVKTAYNDWLTHFSLSANAGYACHLTTSLNQLVNVLSGLESVYPQAVLANAEGETPEDTVGIILR